MPRTEPYNLDRSTLGYRLADFTGLIPPWKPDSFWLTDYSLGIRRT